MNEKSKLLSLISDLEKKDIDLSVQDAQPDMIDITDLAIDITNLLTEDELAGLFSAFGEEDWDEVDKLITAIEENESKGLEALLNLEFKKDGAKPVEDIAKKPGDKLKGHVVGANKLKIYWTVGKGGQKIQWRTPGDWTRCVAELSKYLGVRAKGYCALRHKEMDGFYPNDNKDPNNVGHDLKKVVEKAKGHAKKGEKKVYSKTASNISTKSFGDTMSAKTKAQLDDSPAMQYKSFPVKGLNVVDEEQGIVACIISVTGIKDLVNDIIKPGAFAQTLEKRLPKGVWSHNWDAPVSKTLEAKELLPGDPSLPKTMADGSPWNPLAGALYIKTMFNMDTQRGRDAFMDVKFFGAEQEWSLGYNVPIGGATIEQKTGIRLINYLDFYEYSPVLFGAMPEARTLSVKDAQTSFKAFTGAASGWLGQNNSIDNGDGDGADLENGADENIDSSATRVFTGDEIQLIQNGIQTLQDILAMVTGSGADSDNDGDSNTDNDSDSDGFNDIEGGQENSDAGDMGYDTLTEAVDDLITSSDSVPQDVSDAMSSAAAAFDAAIAATDMDALDTAANQVLDMVQAQLESPDVDPDTTIALETIAKMIATAIEEITNSGDSSTQDPVPPSPKQPMNEDMMDEKSVEDLLSEAESFLNTVKE